MIAPTFTADRMRVRFDRFDLDAYRLFIRCKALPESEVEFDAESETYTISTPARFADILGVQRPAADGDWLPLPSHLFDDQCHLVRQAMDAKRFALWAQCGLGKTAIGLEFARQVTHRTGGRVLILTLNEVVGQWADEAAKFYGDAYPIRRLQSRAEMKEWCEHGEWTSDIAITNYEKFNPDEAGQTVNECRHLAGVVVDESSRLKGGGGKQKWALIKSFKGVEYKLSLTATPAPNDTIEFASQASFLEKMRTDADIIWTYFTRDPVTHRWSVKPHARAAFFEFMSSWSVYVNNPKRYGWRASLPDVPPPTYHTIEIEPTPEQVAMLPGLTQSAEGQGELFPDRTNAIQRAKLSQVAKGFIYSKVVDVPGAPKKGRKITRIKSRKPKVVADIVEREAKAGAQVLVWTVFDEETEILSQLIDGDVLTGATKDTERVAILDRFRRGESRVLISRAAMLGFGMNFQFCSAMVFSGWTDSFESLYQAVRRAVRFGQKESVRVYFPVIEVLEGDTLTNIRRKEVEFERSIEEMEANYIKALKRRNAK